MTDETDDRRPKILLVDDSATALMMEKMLLASEPVRVVTAVEGREAITKAVAERPDLVLLDVVMPDLDGFEVCRILRTKDGLRDVPIVMITTRGESENIATGYASGCTDYITKPIKAAEFLAKVREHLPS